MSLTDTTPSATVSLVRLLLQGEGAGILALSVAAYAQTGGGWGLFALLLLVPDLAMVGYAFGKGIGAICYNLAHTYLAPLALGAAGLFSGSDLAVQLALIWSAHIGMDRAVGYGLKYAEGFKSTHLGRV